MLYQIDYATTSEIYTLSLHDALPICDPAETAGRAALARRARAGHAPRDGAAPLHGAAHGVHRVGRGGGRGQDRKSTRLNSSHRTISYAVFCLKKKNNLLDRVGYTSTV